MSDSNPSSKRGILVAIEGIDGCGKSTLVRALGAALEERGIAHNLTAEPTQGKYGKEIRGLAEKGREGVSVEDETRLFVEDRREHVRDLIAPALAAGKVVITDRYYFSTMAYQGARGADPAAIENENLEFAPRPDLLVLLRLPVDEALLRIQESRGDTPDHFEGEAYLRGVAEIFETVKGTNLMRVDATHTTHTMRDEIMAALLPILESR